MFRQEWQASTLKRAYPMSSEEVKPQIVKSDVAGPPYDYATVVTQARLTQLVTITIQLILLFRAYSYIGYYIVIPMAFHALAFYHTFNRFNRTIDGRFDLRQLLSVQDPALKAQYAFALTGSLLFALLAYYSLESFDGGYLSALLYGLSSYAQLGAAALCLGIEVFEVVKQKLQ